MEFDEIPSLPEVKAKFKIDEERALQMFKNSTRRFSFIEDETGEVHFFFDNLDAPAFACLVAKLSHPICENVYEFLKLTLEGARLVKQGTKKGVEMAGKIEGYIRNNSKK